MIVVDSNILAYLYLPGEFTSHAEKLLSDDPDWIAPVLWRSEFRNILAGYLRRQQLNYEQVCAIQREAEDLMAGKAFDPLSEDVLALVRESECSAYDCEFVALAKRHGVRLVTMDKKIIRNFPDVAVGLVSLAA